MSNSLRRNTTFTIPFAPTTRLQANRWLQFATFGPGTPETDISVSTKTNIVPLANTQDDAARLMSIGYVAYLNEQLADTSIPGIYLNNNNPITNPTGAYTLFGDTTFGNTHSGFEAWFYAQGMHGTAQVKMKLFYALTQIFVIAGGGIYEATYDEYWDRLLKSTNLSNTNSYLTLLTDIVYSVGMATMLTYNGNRKANVATGTHPDENMAREIMQLFSIGLYQLNLDGSPILDSNGIPVPTYTRTDIPEHAKIFTGIETSYTDRNLREGGNSPHEQASKTLIAYPGGSPFVIPADAGPYYQAFDCPYTPAGYTVTVTSPTTFTVPRISLSDNIAENYTSSLRYSLTSDLNAAFVVATGRCEIRTYLTTVTTPTTHGLTNGTVIYFTSTLQRDMRILLEYLSNHPTVAPFIAKTLIKFFVTSNPTAGFIKRVATIFNNNGSGVRGDLQAVMKAILLDRETIIPYGINQAVHGRHLTIVDRYLKVARAFKNDMIHATHSNQVSLVAKSNGYPLVTQQSSYFTRPRMLADYTACAIHQTFNIQPGQSTSVFNFFRPGYAPPGTEIGLNGFVAPELQVNTMDAQTFWQNSVSSMCETSSYTYTVYGESFLNTSGIGLSTYGFDMGTPPNTGTVNPSGYTVTSFSSPNDLIGTCVINANFTNALTSQPCICTRRSDNFTVSATLQRPTGTGSKSFACHLDGAPTPTTAIGDIWDFSPLGSMSFSGFPNSSIVSGGGEKSVTGEPPCIMLFYKLAPLITTPATPTLADLNAVIDYLESILMSQPISTTIRGLMIQAGNVTAVAKAPMLNYSDANMDNYYLNMIMTQAQIRVRRMTAVLLSSAEFQIAK